MPGSQPKREINIRKEYLELVTDGVKTVEVRVGYRACGRSGPARSLRSSPVTIGFPPP